MSVTSKKAFPSGPIAVAMSGGTDSSAVAAMLVAEGLEVFGVTAIMTHEFSRCCSDEDVQMARGTAAELGFAHHIVEVQDAFKKQVVDGFVADYISGRTPSPCAVCNREIKFGVLLDRAVELGATRLATGHYARVEPSAGGRFRLLRGVDGAKDQSYFLARLTQSQLARALFPLGGGTKEQVKAYVRDRGLAARRSRESQELCFVTEGTHGAWIDVRSLEAPGPGDIEDVAGHVIGRHLGIHHYTIGQRKGLGIAVGRPVHVAAIDARRNVVVVGDREQVINRQMQVDDIQWIAERPAAPVAVPSPSTCRIRLDVQIRYNHMAAPAEITLHSSDKASIQFREPQFAITPGQLAVFYRDGEVLGSAWIRGVSDAGFRVSE